MEFKYYKTQFINPKYHSAVFSGNMGYLPLIISKMILRDTRHDMRFMDMALISIESHVYVIFSASISQTL